MKAGPLRFSNGFEKQMKNHVEALKCLRKSTGWLQNSEQCFFFFSKRPPPQPIHTPWGRHEQLLQQRKILSLPEEGRKRKSEGLMAEAKALKRQKLSQEQESSVVVENQLHVRVTRMFSSSCSLMFIHVCTPPPPAIKNFYFSEIPIRHGHNPIGKISRGAEGAASQENTILLDKLGRHNSRPMDTGRTTSGGFQDTIHQQAYPPAKRKNLLTRRGGALG